MIKQIQTFKNLPLISLFLSLSVLIAVVLNMECYEPLVDKRTKLGSSTARLLSQLEVGSEECGAPCCGVWRGRSERWERGMWTSLLTSSCWLVMEAKVAMLYEK